MRNNLNFKSEKGLQLALIFIIIFGYLLSINTSDAQTKDQNRFSEFNGLVIDGKTKKSLEFASITVNSTNISTISNLDGKFLLKVPSSDLDKSVTVSYLGYKNKVIRLQDFSKNTVVKMEESFVNLPAVSLVASDPIIIIKKVLKNRDVNYPNEPLIMNAFYRESIKKRRKYASLSEAVVDIYKQPYDVVAKDKVKLFKSRKSTDYTKIDTLVIKLQGGPYNNINMDMIKNKNLFFSDDLFEIYDFTLDKTINLNNKPVFVINFVQKKSVVEPLFKGKLYIDINSYALTKAVFSLNLENLKKASKYFVKKKPAKANVIPVHTKYIVDYRNNNGKWYYNYGRIELSFKIKWDKKLFNSLYHLIIEMAITDWKVNSDHTTLKNKEKLKQNVIINDSASGFSDPKFWGDYNVIEPDKSIENAIRKIKKQLGK
jgi:hypothetical protein